MGEMTTIEMNDGFSLGAYKASPEYGEAKGAIVVIQEIFGVNGHIKESLLRIYLKMLLDLCT